MTPWLNIIGIGEDGMTGLSPAARNAVEGADLIVGGDRHHTLSPDVTAERIRWPHPFNALIDELQANRHRKVVVLATGDPLWFSVGARIATAIPAAEIAFHPQLSAFQWAACRLGWSLADCETLTAHGRPAAQVIPTFWPGARLLILTAGPETPGEIARLLNARGYGASTMHVLGALGGASETRHDGTASAWAESDPAEDLPKLNTLAVHCLGASTPLVGRLPGLPDSVFEHDGKMTKSEVRAITLSRLMPARNEVLWDIGVGCGSVAIEWMRAAPDAMALGIDTHPERLAHARTNADSLGAPRLALMEGRAPDVLDTIPAPEGTRRDLRRPDAVFIGGGLSPAGFERCRGCLSPGRAPVANARPLGREAVATDLHRRHGGTLVRIGIQRAAPVGRMTGWRPSMPVTPWALIK